MRKLSTGAIYINPGPFPLTIGFIPTEQAWLKEMNRLNIQAPYPLAAGQCTWFDRGPKGVTVLVTVHETSEELSPLQITGIIAHESIHVWQVLLDHIGEENRPTNELEAYNYQFIFEQMLAAYIESRRPELFKSPKIAARSKASRKPRSARYN